MKNNDMYELLVVFKGTAAEADVKKELESVKKDLLSLGAQKLEEDTWGRKNVAYKLAGDYSAHFAFFKMALGGNRVKEALDLVSSRDKVVRRMLRKVK